MTILQKTGFGLVGKLALGGLAFSYANSAAAVGATNATPIPEPGPMGLLVLGGVALVIARRISRNK